MAITDALIPTILDTDPGIDDALALLLAWGSPELDVLALTVVAGASASCVTEVVVLRPETTSARM